MDFKSTYGTFDYPDVPVIIQYFRDRYEDDHSLMVRLANRNTLAVYKVEANDIEKYFGTEVKIGEASTTITGRYKNVRRQRRGTFITIYDAYTGKAREIDGNLFKVFGNIGILERAVEPQNHKGSKLLNGNRFAMFQEETKINNIPNTIIVAEMKFRFR